MEKLKGAGINIIQKGLIVMGGLGLLGCEFPQETTKQLRQGVSRTLSGVTKSSCQDTQEIVERFHATNARIATCNNSNKKKSVPEACEDPSLNYQGIKNVNKQIADCENAGFDFNY